MLHLGFGMLVVLLCGALGGMGLLGGRRLHHRLILGVGLGLALAATAELSHQWVSMPPVPELLD